MIPIRHYDSILAIRDELLEELRNTRERSLVITKLDEALMWLDRYYREELEEE